jgi:type II secretory pathway predicted ATPase ExeA/cell division septation protein DedD
MYLSFYNLIERPFQISTEPRFLWPGENHKEALAVLKYGVMSRNAILTLTGDVGTGKTTLINALLADLDSDIVAASIVNSKIDLIGFLNLIGQAFHIPERLDRIEDFIFQFSKFLRKQFNDNRHVLLIVDEAHKLSQEILEQTRLLSNIEIEGKNLISIFLVGQNELNKKLLSRDCRALRQRITIHYQLKPLSESETLQYCNHRLNVAGSQTEIFNQPAIREIYHFSRGYPRLINIICEQALITGYVKGVREIDPAIIQECSRELRLPGEIHINLKPDLTGMLSSVHNSISKLSLPSKTRTIYYQIKKQAKQLPVYLGDRFMRESLYQPSKYSADMEYSPTDDAVKISKDRNDINSQTRSHDNKVFLIKYNRKSGIQDLISRLTKPGLGNTSLGVGLIVLSLAVSLWLQRGLSFESNLKLSDSLKNRPKLPTTIETSVNLELTTPSSSESITQLHENRLYTRVVEQMDKNREIRIVKPLEIKYESRELEATDNEEKYNPGIIPTTEASGIESIKSQSSAQKLTDAGRRDTGKSESVSGVFDRSKIAYSIQTGAFLFKENAAKRAHMLRKKGYPADIVRFDDAKGKIWYTVRFGAYNSLTVARKKASDFSAKENLDSIARPHDRL